MKLIRQCFIRDAARDEGDQPAEITQPRGGARVEKALPAEGEA